MSTALGFIAMVSRFFVISHHVLSRTATLYNSLSNTLPQCKLPTDSEGNVFAASTQTSLISTLNYFRLLIGKLPIALNFSLSPNIHVTSHRKQQQTSQLKFRALGNGLDEDVGEPIESTVYENEFGEPLFAVSALRNEAQSANQSNQRNERGDSVKLSTTQNSQVPVKKRKTESNSQKRNDIHATRTRVDLKLPSVAPTPLTTTTTIQGTSTKMQTVGQKRTRGRSFEKKSKRKRLRQYDHKN